MKSIKLTSYFITLLTIIHFVWANDYEIIEEEPISLNSLEKANAGFVCESEGYFADVAFGCQFYHICENSNNPYDKPKHTFSCVNGTVFNQMSFTCTRYDDSIPCEASPNYFYLNKRNGDPKAYFLTEEDIFKPSQSSQSARHSQLSSGETTSSLFNVGPNFATSTRSITSTTTPHKSDSNYNKLINTRDSTDATHHNIADSERRNRLISSVINNYDPVDDNINLGDIFDVNSKSSNQQQTRPPPYELTPKISHYTSSSQSPSLLKFPSLGKYEPATKVSTYVPLNTHYEDKSNFQNDAAAGEKLIFGSIRDNFASNNPKSDVLTHREPLKSTYSPFSDVVETSTHLPPVEPLPTPATTRKTTFTPAAFSRMYIENQKAARLDPRIPPSYERLVQKRNELLAGRNNEQSTPQSLTELPPMSKYVNNDRYNNDRYQQINSNQYIVPSSIRIIESNKNDESSEINASGEQEHASNIQEHQQPIKIHSFLNDNRNNGIVSHEQPQQHHHHHHLSLNTNSNINNNNNNNNNNEQQSQFVDYGGTNYKVVKQVKGKNLLIDPSLENDPARDNIIAQVLEMLSKYN